MAKYILGIDISKLKFDVALAVRGTFKCKEFKNCTDGFVKLRSWLTKYGVSDVHACMEATSNYGDMLAHYLYDIGFSLSVVNPARIKSFGQSELSRTKTDKNDAQLIARFCHAMKPDLWQPKAAYIREMQQWVKRAEALKRMKRQELNRKGTTSYSEISASIDQVITTIDKMLTEAKQAIKKLIAENNDLAIKSNLLESIPGIGEETISWILAFFGKPEDFERAKEVSAYLGLNPRQNQSGSSIRGRTKISKMGDATLRKALYMPALTAIRYNPVIKAFAANLKQRGKPPKVIIVAAMRKLTHIAYGVLKNNHPFNSNWEQKSAPRKNVS
jgi:transposase